jgi:glycosyltransferase involved in cell wall biosynthesis
VVFQSFEEVSTLFFMLLNPSKRVHLIVTNNLRPDRLRRHPHLGRFLVRAVMKRAASVFVHSQYEVARIRELVPAIERSKVFVKPFHQMSQPRKRLAANEKTRNVLFLGPDQLHKKVGPVLQLMKADHAKHFHYVFCSMARDTAARLRLELDGRLNTELAFGYVEPGDYYRRFSEARIVILTHDSDFEGALSGAFCDAIASGTPVVARLMAPHDEFFARFGPMGFLVDYDSPGWYAPLLNGTLAQHYREFQRNMAACRAACSTEAIREVFRASFSRSANQDSSD